MPSRSARLPRGKFLALAAGAIAIAMAVKVVQFPSTRRLVAGDFSATAPVWSPTGNHLAFLIEDKVGAHAAVFSFADREHIVVGDAADTDAEAMSWSPDGLQLAYEGRDAEGTTGIHVYDVATTESRPLAPGSSPRWRADGSLMAVCGPEAVAPFDSDSEDAFEEAPRYDMEPRFCRIDPASGAITRTALAAEDGMALSPVLDRVLYEQDGAVFAADLEGGEPIRLLTSGEGASARWTPAGDRIVYAEKGASGLELRTMRADGGDRRPLLPGATVADPASVQLTPDGTQVFFVAPDGDLHVADVGSGAPRRLSSQHALKHRYAVSPDGQRIAYEVRPDAKTPGAGSRSEIWVTSP